MGPIIHLGGKSRLGDERCCSNTTWVGGGCLLRIDPSLDFALNVSKEEKHIFFLLRKPTNRTASHANDFYLKSIFFYANQFINKKMIMFPKEKLYQKDTRWSYRWQRMTMKSLGAAIIPKATSFFLYSRTRMEDVVDSPNFLMPLLLEFLPSFLLLLAYFSIITGASHRQWQHYNCCSSQQQTWRWSTTQRGSTQWRVNCLFFKGCCVCFLS